MSAILSTVESPASDVGEGGGRPASPLVGPIPVRFHRALVSTVATAGVVTAWATCTWTAMHVHADPLLHKAALFVHLAALVLGFGTVLVIDYYGLLWLLGRRSLPAVVESTAPLHVPVWVGVGALLASGVLLRPDLNTPLTQVKLVLVLVIALNGVHATALHRRLAGLGQGGGPSTGLLVRGAASAVVSQVAWWGAVVIGFINGRH